MCFLCGCVYVHRKKPAHDLRRNQKQGENHIQWYRPCETTDLFFRLDSDQTEIQYGQQTYLERFSSDNGKFLDLRRHMSEFEDWIADIPFSTGDVRILCCLEDRRCVAKGCAKQKRLCSQCEVPVCRTCDAHARQRNPTQSPVSLANDMMIFYAPKALCADGGLTVMEMICASPCITSMICFSLEVKYGNLFNTGAYA